GTNYPDYSAYKRGIQFGQKILDQRGIVKRFFFKKIDCVLCYDVGSGDIVVGTPPTFI
ncbi:hypothetical protein ACJX0J_039631, partial [Zea mays]